MSKNSSTLVGTIAALIVVFGMLGLGTAFMSGTVAVDSSDDVAAVEVESDGSTIVGAVSLVLPEGWSAQTDEEDGFSTLEATSDDGLGVVYVASPYSITSFAGVETSTAFMMMLWGFDATDYTEAEDEGGALYRAFDYSYEDEDSGETYVGYCVLVYSGDDLSVVTANCAESAEEEYLSVVADVAESVKAVDPEEPVEVEGDSSIFDAEAELEDESDDDADAEADYSILDVLDNMPDFEEETFTGAGEGTVELPVTGDPVLLEVTLEGDGEYAILTIDDDGEMQEALSWGTGPYSGTLTTYASCSTATSIQLTTNGNWTIVVKPMNSMEELQSGAVYSGDNVLYIDTDELSELTVVNSGESDFAVRAVGVEDAGTLVSDEGDFAGTVEWGESHCFLLVNSDGTWSISW